MLKILTVFGTRPEAIKMAVLVNKLKQEKNIESRLCVTSQHREMLDQVLNLFSIKPDYDLNIMKPNQTLSEITSSILVKLSEIFNLYKPDYVLVHGDTSTTLAASLASYYQKINIAHIEAGLRTYNNYSPWPEEINRRVTSVLAEKHYAPTENAKKNLLQEYIPESKILVTGNTVIDSLLTITEKLKNDKNILASMQSLFEFLNPQKKLILVTGHRRESFGEGFENICKALLTISKRDDVEICYPVHMNPNVEKPVTEMLKGQKNIFLTKPYDYLPFVYLMNRSMIILTDSGGIQEEAPSLGKPILVMRENTERPEAVHAGTVKLVGTNIEKIIFETKNLLDNKEYYESMSTAVNPYGDGKATDRIIKDLLQ
ncbi:MAG: UDP-N-acetylglucosamine 2-epimerase (non-hydrolyzing) [Spirochaetia bacterium]|nr:UDP-N-acetylglucosamine 2-epimerase (non-hydrolyzing) [Spirochaetia bacterium]